MKFANLPELEWRYNYFALLAIPPRRLDLVHRRIRFDSLVIAGLTRHHTKLQLPASVMSQR